jgi:hypothetical protein
MENLIDRIHEKSKEWQASYPDIRVGQSLMLALQFCNPRLYGMFVGTLADCFYADSKIEQFWDAVAAEVLAYEDTKD